MLNRRHRSLRAHAVDKARPERSGAGDRHDGPGGVSGALDGQHLEVYES